MGQIKRKLSLLDVFCIASGAMISSGLFILPGLAYAKAGPAVMISYILAGILAIPTALSKAELTTAMPKAGGDYFFIMRGFGPLLGTIAGLSAWFSLSLKSAFALLGMGAYISLFIHLPFNIVALICCVFFIVLNLLGVKEAALFQVLLVAGLLTILFTYVVMGFPHIKYDHFTPFFGKGINPVLATASFIFISYGGLTKIAALAEEIETRRPVFQQELATRLEERIGEMTDVTNVPAERLAQEVAFLVDRSDVQEELDRLGSHLSHFHKLLEEEGAVGKRLDFLSQELLRELNTLGSKGRDVETIRLVLDAKLFCEQLREQVQNIE